MALPVVITRIARVVIPRLLSTFQSLATKQESFQYGVRFHGVLYEAIKSSRNHLKLKKSELGRLEGITIEILLSRNF